jgi:hypothetical protein
VYEGAIKNHFYKPPDQIERSESDDLMGMIAEKKESRKSGGKKSGSKKRKSTPSKSPVAKKHKATVQKTEFAPRIIRTTEGAKFGKGTVEHIKGLLAKEAIPLPPQ